MGPGPDDFVRDLGLALDAWRRDPRLPILTLMIALISVASSMLAGVNPALGALGCLTFPVTLFSVGFNGTQRLWYLWIYRGGRANINDVWSASWGFFGRFAVLGLLSAALMLPFFIAFWSAVIG